MSISQSTFCLAKIVILCFSGPIVLSPSFLFANEKYEESPVSIVHPTLSNVRIVGGKRFSALLLGALAKAQPISVSAEEAGKSTLEGVSLEVSGKTYVWISGYIYSCRERLRYDVKSSDVLILYKLLIKDLRDNRRLDYVHSASYRLAAFEMLINKDGEVDPSKINDKDKKAINFDKQ